MTEIEINHLKSQPLPAPGRMIAKEYESYWNISFYEMADGSNFLHTLDVNQEEIEPLRDALLQIAPLPEPDSDAALARAVERVAKELYALIYPNGGAWESAAAIPRADLRHRARDLITGEHGNG